MTTVKKVKTVASVFELPQRLGVLQYVEYEPSPRELCTSEGCLYEGLLTAEGCRKGVCVKYHVWVHSRDRRRWEAKERWRRRRDEEVGVLGNRWLTLCGSWAGGLRWVCGMNIEEWACGLIDTTSSAASS